jgi:hypothetical protein
VKDTRLYRKAKRSSARSQKAPRATRLQTLQNCKAVTIKPQNSKKARLKKPGLFVCEQHVIRADLGGNLKLKMENEKLR